MTETPRPPTSQQFCVCGHTEDWHRDNPDTPNVHCLADADDGRCECPRFRPETPRPPVITRWDFINADDDGWLELERPDGEWVKADEALAEIAKLEAALQAARAERDAMRQKLRDGLKRFRSRPSEAGLGGYAAKPVNELIEVIEPITEEPSR